MLTCAPWASVVKATGAAVPVALFLWWQLASSWHYLDPRTHPAPSTIFSTAWDLDAFAERAKTSIALERVGRPEEVVGAALFLAGPASSYCTGAVLRLDGGYR